MPHMEPVLLYITAPNREEAISLSHMLVSERLVACASVVDHATSLYWWQGALEQTPESIIIAKSVMPLLERITARVKELHSYQCPCVTAIPIVGGSPEYLEWLAKEVQI